MAVNLVANYEEDRAITLLNASFAQFRTEARRSALEVRAQEREQEIEEFRATAECERGDLWAYLDAGGAAAASDHQSRTSLRRWS